jgi:hypothetical protein
MRVVSRVVSSRTIECLAYSYSVCYAFPESIVYVVTQEPLQMQTLCTEPVTLDDWTEIMQHLRG